jgi:hypothetical protein
MVVNTDSSRRFDVAKVIRLALRAAGVISAWDVIDDAVFGEGRDLLDLVLDTLALEGVTATTEAFETVSVSAGTSAYQLAASTLEILDPVWWAAAGEAEPPEDQTPVAIVSAQRWRELDDATTSATPSYVYAYKGGSGLEARLSPIPSASGTLRLRTQRMLVDAGGGANQVELATWWTQFLVQALGAELAQAHGLTSNCQLCLVRAEVLKKKCLNKDSDNVQGQVTWSHSTVWDSR